MAKKKKKARGDTASEPGTKPATTKSAGKAVGTSLAGLLKGVSLEAEPTAPAPKRPPRTTRARPKAPAPKAADPTAATAKPSPAAAPDRPSETLRGDDRIAFHQAMGGVRPLRSEGAPVARPERVSRPAPEVRAEDAEARARLGALVAGGIRFDLAHDGDRILGRRAGLPLRLADDLSRPSVVPEASLDLHGMRGDEATQALVRWIRAQQRRGASHVCVIHGKGLHSESGVSTLRDRVVTALTEGGAAPVVRAFASAHRSRGGTGALIVALEP